MLLHNILSKCIVLMQEIPNNQQNVILSQILWWWLFCFHHINILPILSIFFLNPAIIGTFGIPYKLQVIQMMALQSHRFDPLDNFHSISLQTYFSMLFINNYYYFINWNFARLHMKNVIQIQFTINPFSHEFRFS